MPPDSGQFIHGNRAGFLRLAVAALRAAKGNTQSFKGETWVVDYEVDWGVVGFKYDALAHMDPPPPEPTGWHKLRGQLLGYGMLGSILAVFMVGFITSINWIEHLFTHHWW
jgi:hypothetical protein